MALGMAGNRLNPAASKCTSQSLRSHIPLGKDHLSELVAIEALNIGS
ncbi:hypothetical protein PAAG_12058 [Paracoccidioides lutzii Pb01]|uniref:Uncharacterized protein n=1 Tax=Paracoccidioides lutzii (strain ATCC MYA-826 / Pb01) TaxID=502779 RepID=A0A0A2V4K6_PARBA|nr:hypothetical protein PAAG_12058 [Paracoccidioides lutzii Pb01]KGQ01287.1 hypothetical protein PAAG_12058 [Paracoccidioides lutzii Pb01]